MAIRYTTPYTRIEDERARQERLFPDEDNSPRDWLTILIEEVGEVARALIQGDMYEENNDLDTELVQVAAVIVAWLEDKAKEHNV